MNTQAIHKPSTSSPLLPSVFPNEETATSSHKPSSRLSSARQSPALRDDLPLPPGTDSASVPYISVSQQDLLPPKSFQPFFAIVEDGRTGEIAHPSVHYVFSDDDPDVITAASLRSLGADEVIPLSPKRSRVPEGEGLEAEGSYGRDTALPPVRPGAEERYILLDLNEDGQVVNAAKSLSKEWAVTGTSVRNAPTFDDSAGDGTSGALMLKVDGLGMNRLARSEQDGPDRAQKLLEDKKRLMNGDTVAAMAQVVEGLRKGMDTIGKVVGNGDGQGSREEE